MGHLDAMGLQQRLQRSRTITPAVPIDMAHRAKPQFQLRYREKPRDEALIKRCVMRDEEFSPLHQLLDFVSVQLLTCYVSVSDAVNARCLRRDISTRLAQTDILIDDADNRAFDPIEREQDDGKFDNFIGMRIQTGRFNVDKTG
mgnify:CR=1 FL=1